MATLYADVSDLRLVLDGTDAGTGTAAQLTDQQLTLALTAASTRVSTYTGTVWDSSTPQAIPPDLLHDLTLDLAAWWATTYYLKHKDMGPQHPIQLRYNEAKMVLQDLRDGKIRPDAQAPGSAGAETGHVINPLPNIFTFEDSNTTWDPMSAGIAASVPSDTYEPGLDWSAGAEYSG
jgi:Protein of unknown function (DUF1320)